MRERVREREKIWLSFEACTSASDPILDVVKDMCSSLFLCISEGLIRSKDQKRLQVVSGTLTLTNTASVYNMYI